MSLDSAAGDAASRGGEQGPASGRTPKASGRDRNELVARTLAVVGGFVDGVGYLALFRLFTAHQSGNSAGLGVALAVGDWSQAWRRAISIAAFVTGVGLGALIVELGRARRVRSSGALVGAAEIVALAAALGVGETAARAGRITPADTAPYAVAAACLAAGMGLQTVALRRVGRRTVRTTFVTGVLTNLAETFVAAWFNREHRGRRQQLAYARLLGSVWVLYLGGAVAGAAADRAWSFACLALPMTAVAVVARWQFRAGHQPAVADKGLVE